MVARQLTRGNPESLKCCEAPHSPPVTLPYPPRLHCRKPVASGKSRHVFLPMKKKSEYLTESWLEGTPDRLDVLLPVVVAQRALAGWTDTQARALWSRILDTMRDYRWKQFGKAGTPRSRKPSRHDAASLGPTEPLATPGAFLALLLEALPSHDIVVEELVDTHGHAAVFATTLLAIAESIPADDSPDWDHADWVHTSVVACWEALYYLQRVDAAARKLSDADLVGALRDARRAQARAAARRKHLPRDRVHAKVLEFYRKGGPWQSKRNAAMRIWRQVKPYAIKVRYISPQPVEDDPEADERWRTVYEWLRKLS